jgi:hypothetical protein
MTGKNFALGLVGLSLSGCVTMSYLLKKIDPVETIPSAKCIEVGLRQVLPDAEVTVREVASPAAEKDLQVHVRFVDQRNKVSGRVSAWTRESANLLHIWPINRRKILEFYDVLWFGGGRNTVKISCLELATRKARLQAIKEAVVKSCQIQSQKENEEIVQVECQ